MRIKTRGGKAKRSRSATAKSSPAIQPASYLDEFDDEYVTDRNMPRQIGEGDDKQNNDIANGNGEIAPKYIDDKQNNGVADGSGEITLNSIEVTDPPAKKCRVSRTNGVDMDVLRFKAETCSICDCAGEEVLVCSEISCPIALHVKCMNAAPTFDDDGNFYCPYCWYKIQLIRSKKLRDKAMVAKKALSDFLDSGVVGGNEKKENAGEVEGELRDLSLGGVRNCVKDRMDNYKSQDQPVQLRIGKTAGSKLLEDSIKIGNLNKKNISETHELQTLEDGGRRQEQDSREEDDLQQERIVEDQQQGPWPDACCMEKEECANEFEILEDGERTPAKDSRNVDGVLHEGTVKDQEGELPNACCKEGEKSTDGSHHVSTKQACNAGKEPEEGQDGGEEEEQMHPDSPATTMLSTGSASDTIGFGSDDESLAVHQSRIKRRNSKKALPLNVDSSKKQSSQPRTSPVGNSRHQYEKVFACKTPSRSQEPAKPFKSLTFPREKRKRFHWTTEEEEILKEGVQKFSTAVNKNVPWRKILEFGQHVFHNTRTPVDLKDKWRNIMAKESSTINRRSS